MSQTLMEGAEVEYDARPGGILASAMPAPAGWVQGLGACSQGSAGAPVPATGAGGTGGPGLSRKEQVAL